MKVCPNCRAAYPNHFAVCPRDAAPLLEAEDWSAGTVIRGKYRVLCKLGQGGMGAVYKAVHTKFDQVRALKVMTADMAADADFVRRFEREAMVMSKLQHPNVVRVDDIDETEDGRPFIVMEFVEGQSLRRVIQQEGRLHPLRVCSIAKQAAAGPGAAHVLGMVHRDVKPDNIVLLDTPAGETAKILDFGIAKLKEAQLGDGVRTATGMVIGTPQYLSPEQALGKRNEELDGRSDLYSLGLVMYQMLTCELPFQADSAVGWMMARLNEPPRSIQLARPDLDTPDGLAKLVMRCLEKERDLRPADAGALIDEIEQAEKQIRGWVQPVEPAANAVPDQIQPPTGPAKVVKPAPEKATKATSTSHWARGWRFWAGLAAIFFLPYVLGPFYDFINASRLFDAPMPFPAKAAAVVAAFGGSGWYLLSRRHWALGVIGIPLFSIFVLLQGIRVYNICNYMPPWGFHEAASAGLTPIDELKKSNLCPISVSLGTPGVDSNGQATFKVDFQNTSSNARAMDWKAETIYFDGQGKVLSDAPIESRTPAYLEPGKSVPMNLTGPDLGRVKSVKMVFKEVDYELSNPAGAKEQGVWTNAHFQEDLQKARQP